MTFSTPPEDLTPPVAPSQSQPEYPELHSLQASDRDPQHDLFLRLLLFESIQDDRYSTRSGGGANASHPTKAARHFRSLAGLQEVVIEVLESSQERYGQEGMPLSDIYAVICEIALSRHGAHSHISRDTVWQALLHLVFRGLIDQTVDDYHYVLCN